MPVPQTSPSARGAAPCLSLPRVLALVGGLGLIAAFFMPWFSAQNLLLSGQFLHQFLANPGDLRRFLPGSSGTAAEAQMLRTLVDLFPVCGGVATLAALIGGLTPWRWPANLVLGLAGAIPLVGWAGGITRLPPGANAEVGLWLIAASSVAVLAGLSLDVAFGRRGP
jgi:hypothetical protein